VCAAHKLGVVVVTRNVCLDAECVLVVAVCFVLCALGCVLFYFVWYLDRVIALLGCLSLVSCCFYWW